MKRWSIVCLALVLSGCSVHAVRQMLTPKPEPLVSLSRMQFDCTAGGLYIFEDFPDIVRSHSGTGSATPTTTSEIANQQDNADISGGCLDSMR